MNRSHDQARGGLKGTTQHLRQAVAGGRGATELGKFGWWFASGAFDQEWSLATLEAVARADVAIDALHNVWERFAALSSEHLLRVGHLADVILAYQTDDDGLAGTQEDLTAIIAALCSSADPAACEIGRSLRSRMRSRGYRIDAPEVSLDA